MILSHTASPILTWHRFWTSKVAAKRASVSLVPSMLRMVTIAGIHKNPLLWNNGSYCCKTVGYEGDNSCITMVPRNILQKQSIVERHGCATMVWDIISAKLAKDAKLIWDNICTRI
jgi:hypothetical protein